MEAPLATISKIDRFTDLEQLWTIAELFLKLGRSNQAVTLAYEISQKDSKYLNRYRLFCVRLSELAAELAEEIGDHAKAEFYWEQVTQQIPQEFEPWYGLAIACANQGAYQKALSALEKAIKINPRHQKARELYEKLRKERLSVHS